MHGRCDVLAEKLGTYGIDIQNMVGIIGDIDRLSLGDIGEDPVCFMETEVMNNGIT